MAFGDLFLDDIHSYRIENMHKANMQCLFPLWHRPTAELAREFTMQGFQAVLCCVDEQALSPVFAGREYDDALLRDLRPGTDPSGENGEFHTFVYAGPIVRKPIVFSRGERVRREKRFQYCDLIPVEKGYEHLATASHSR